MVFHCAIESMSGAWNMFFANDMHGEKIHIDNADVALPYFCPACGGAMVQKRGNINAKCHCGIRKCKISLTKKRKK